MHAIIPAAGEGSRMRELTDDTPKPMLKVNGFPLIEYALQDVVHLGADRIVVVVGEMRDQIQDHVTMEWKGVNVRYVIQPEPTGLADAIGMASNDVEDDVIIRLPDEIFMANLAHAVAEYKLYDPDGMLVTERVPDVWRYAEVHADDGEVLRTVEKPDAPVGNLAETGMYIFDKEFVDIARHSQYERLQDVTSMFISTGAQVRHSMLRGRRVNVNTPKDIERAEEMLG